MIHPPVWSFIPTQWLYMKKYYIGIQLTYFIWPGCSLFIHRPFLKHQQMLFQHCRSHRIDFNLVGCWISFGYPIRIFKGIIFKYPITIYVVKYCNTVCTVTLVTNNQRTDWIQLRHFLIFRTIGLLPELSSCHRLTNIYIYWYLALISLFHSIKFMLKRLI